MTKDILTFPDPFTKSTKKPIIDVYFLTTKSFTAWLEQQADNVQTQIKTRGFKAEPKHICKIINSDGSIGGFIAGLSDPIHYLDAATLAQSIQNSFDKSLIEEAVFAVQSNHDAKTVTQICIGWGLSAYSFNRYSGTTKPYPILLWPDQADVKEVMTTIQAIFLLRNLINTAPNDLGTEELADAAKQVAKTHKAKIKIINKPDAIKKGFPMIEAVGKGSPRPPQLVDIKWGKTSHPKVTIVGKGIVYDTGGLNLKPGAAMRDMKKDMGGAAHALGVAWMIMSLNLPVQLRVLLPIAENSTSGNSYRPGDVLQTRKGLTVEIGDTDAEGRLVVAEALTYACEDKPDLLIDFCTLTGAARVALGYEIPAFFSNNDKFIEELRLSSVTHDDPVWPLPLWEGYQKEMDSTVADLCNDGKGRAGAIHGALFLNNFIDKSVDWIHLDCFAWEANGKAGRPQGGADTGMRAIFNFIQTRYTA